MHRAAAQPHREGRDRALAAVSRGNAIELRATADETAALIRGARTDSIRRISYAPIRARRAELAADAGYARQVLRDGGVRTRAIAEQTLSQVRGAMGMRY